MAAPNQTLYISNLNDKLRKPDLRLSLYTLFSTYGVVLDVVALKTMKHRGQAFVAFRDVTSATQAMRAMDGVNIFGKEMVRSTAGEWGGRRMEESGIVVVQRRRVRERDGYGLRDEGRDKSLFFR
jgi:RNA recognition motif-containing protein